MFYNKVEICGVNTSRLKSLSNEENKELLQKSKCGDENARNALINGNLRLVLSIIKRFGGKRESVDDIFQVGCIGLMKAIDNFNTELDVRFSTYAVPMIIGEIKRYLRDNNSLRVSRSVRDLAYKALQAREQLSGTLPHEPTVGEIIKRLRESGIDTSETAVSYALEAITEPISIFDPVYGDSGGDTLYVMDQISDDDNTDDALIENIALRDALEKLGEREREIINMRFFSGKTQMEIADEIGISQAQVSRLEKGAISRIKKNM